MDSHIQPARLGMLVLMSAGVIIGLVLTWLPVLAGSISWIISAGLRRHNVARVLLAGASLLFCAVGLLFAAQAHTLWDSGGFAAIARRPMSTAVAVVALGAAIGIVAALGPDSTRRRSQATSASLRSRDAGEPWFRRAAVLLSFSGFALASEAYKLWQYGGGEGVQPSPLVHDGFHKLLDLGGILACVSMTLVLAWGPVSRGNWWGLIGLAAFTPAAALFIWAGGVALANGTDWGYQHVLLEGYVAAMPVLLILAAICVVIGRKAASAISRSGSP